MTVPLRNHLLAGQVIPAHPLALTAERRLDERHQRALTRYYFAAGAGGIAVGVHTTQFAIRDAKHGLFEPVLALAAETAAAELRVYPRPFVKVAGALGRTGQATRETEIAARLGYDAVLLSLAAWEHDADQALLDHCRAVAGILPLFGFYLQPAVGGRVLNYDFWHGFAEIPNVVAIKIAPFNRYRTLDVARGVAAARAEERVTLYTGNDDHIVLDLAVPLAVRRGGEELRLRIRGGLLGHWSVWTKRAVELLARVQRGPVDADLLALDARVTDCNGALFDVAHDFAGCIPGCHEVLRRQGLLEGIWCLDPNETLSPGQAAEIDRVCREHADLSDDDFVRANLERWMG